MAAIERIWYSNGPWSGLLQPIASLFGYLAHRRHKRYLAAVAAGSLWRPPVPVIVVGNISVGGTGKTPVVIALVEHLSALGFRPGVVSRGYGGKADTLPLMVNAQTSPRQCGDEPLLVHLRTGRPVVIDPDRPAAVRHLLARSDCNIVISDDGLQHYALYRDIELAVVDGQRGLGNGLCLPAGPLRERASRLAQVDAVLINGGGELAAAPQGYGFYLQPRRFVALGGGASVALEDFARQPPVHAVAGIGNPDRFFRSLREMGFEVIAHEFEDHFSYSAQDIEFKDNYRVIMTEKDAVKCRAFSTRRHWYLAVDAVLPDQFLQWLESRLQAVVQPAVACR
jgi:tetraacyldisaccharide 4'-kinase